MTPFVQVTQERINDIAHRMASGTVTAEDAVAILSTIRALKRQRDMLRSVIAEQSPTLVAVVDSMGPAL